MSLYFSSNFFVLINIHMHKLQPQKTLNKYISIHFHLKILYSHFFKSFFKKINSWKQCNHLLKNNSVKKYNFKSNLFYSSIVSIFIFIV